MKAIMKFRISRVISVTLAALSFLVALASVLSAAIMYEHDFYSKTDPEEIKKDIIRHVVYEYAAELFELKELYDTKEGKSLKEVLDEYANSREIYYSVYLKLIDRTDVHIVSMTKNYSVEYAFEYEFVQNGYFHSQYQGNAPDTEYDTYIIKIRIPSVRSSEDGIYYVNKYFSAVYSHRYDVLWLSGISSLVSVLMFSLSLFGAGRRRRTDETVMSFFDRIPFDLLIVTETITSLAVFAFVFDGAFHDLFVFVCAVIAVFICSVAVTLTSMSLVVRSKCGTLWKNNLSVILIKKAFSLAVKSFRAIPIIWRTLLLTSAVAFLNFITILMALETEIFLLFFAFLWFAIIAFTSFAAYNMVRLKKGAEKLAAGDLDSKISSDNLFFDFKNHAENLNRIGDGMSLAVEERMKGERFKTELITNVSHDIKTPVTSIINYVDLLGKCGITDENALSYIDVLRRQSERLKKLTEDIVEASKASSGVLAVNLTQCDLGILLTQVAGEYEERFTSAGLTLVTHIPEFTVPVIADGKHIFRIFDNLLGNALKYSLPSTRVHLTLTETGGAVFASVSNVSRDPLPENGDELVERFARGDTSRHTEGSGLGLSIARSLAELQGARLKISTDGDFFKAVFEIKSNRTN